MSPYTDKTLDESPTHLLHRAGQRASDVFAEEIANKDLTPRQFAILLAVAQNEGASQTTLVHETGIDRSTLADVVRRMLKKGLLQRRRTREDARAYAVKLTERGRATLEAAQPAAQRADSRLLEYLDKRQRQAFLEALHVIAQAEAEAGRSRRLRAAG